MSERIPGPGSRSGGWPVRKRASDDRAILRAVEATYQAAGDPTLWPAVLQCLCDSVGGVMASFDAYDFSNCTGSVSHVVGVDSTQVRIYEEQFASRNILVQRAKPWLRSGAVVLA